MKKYFLILMIFSGGAFAQSAGNSGLSFLKLGFGARNVAMGDLGVVVANDLTSLNYNPSLLAENLNPQLSFTHNSLFQDLNSEMIAGSFSVFNIPFAVGINTTSVSDIEIRTRPGEPEGKFNAHYFSASLSTAHKIIDNLNGGITIKYLYENLYSDDATGMAVDLGLSYRGFIDGLSLGASLKNIGSMKALRAESTKLPTDFRLGAAYDFALPQIKMDFTALAGFQKYTDANDSHLHFGGEISYDKFFAVRLGYMSNYDSKNITAGFGILWKSLNIDYAYVPVKYGLGDSHIFSFIYSFN
jgi:hypothetical protein